MPKKNTSRKMTKSERENFQNKFLEIACRRKLECHDPEDCVHELFILIEKKAKYLKWQIFEDHAVTEKSRRRINEIREILQEVEILLQDCSSDAHQLRAARDRNGVWFRIQEGQLTY